MSCATDELGSERKLTCFPAPRSDMANAESLLCEEDMIRSPWSENGRSISSKDANAIAIHGFFSSFPLNDDEAVACLLQKESSFMPCGGYQAALLSQCLGDGRSTAVLWILKARSYYNFGAPTIALAVNYFDRYLSHHLSKPWKAWMIHLLSVTCLSIAAKMEEVDVPLLLDLQIEGLEHVFEAKTIQRMELAVLSSLDWRMSSVTAFSYVDELLYRLEVNNRLRKSLAIRVTEILLGSISEADFLEFRPSVVTLSAVSCALEEVMPLHSKTLNNTLLKMLPVAKVNLNKCSKLMEERVVDPVSSLVSLSHVLGTPSSPATVVEVSQKQNPCSGVARNCSDPLCSRRLEEVISVVGSLNSRKRKLDDTMIPSIQGM